MTTARPHKTNPVEVSGKVIKKSSITKAKRRFSSSFTLNFVALIILFTIIAALQQLSSGDRKNSPVTEDEAITKQQPNNEPLQPHEPETPVIHSLAAITETPPKMAAPVVQPVAGAETWQATPPAAEANTHNVGSQSQQTVVMVKEKEDIAAQDTKQTKVISEPTPEQPRIDPKSIKADRRIIAQAIAKRKKSGALTKNFSAVELSHGIPIEELDNESARQAYLSANIKMNTSIKTSGAPLTNQNHNQSEQ